MNKSKGKVVKAIRTIPIDEIRFLNPRFRNRRNFQEIVQSIAKVVGLRKVCVKREIPTPSAGIGRS
jgi:ParB family transcriptional regulator, chromosome partitioning protein